MRAPHSAVRLHVAKQTAKFFRDSAQPRARGLRRARGAVPGYVAGNLANFRSQRARIARGAAARARHFPFDLQKNRRNFSD